MPSSSVKFILAPFVMLAAGIVLVGGLLYQGQVRRLRQEAETQLATVARTKVDQISAWLADRRVNAAATASSPLFGAAVERWLAAPSQDLAAAVQDRLEALAAAYQFDDAVLVDVPGGKLLGVRQTTSPLAEEELRSLRLALDEGKPALTTFYRQAVGDPGAHVAVTAPVRGRNLGSRKSLTVLLLVIDAKVFLDPLVQSWPTASRSAEVYLIARHGDRARFLTTPRHRKHLGLEFEIPLTRTEVPAVQAVLGREGLFQGRDSLGVPVLSFLTRVPETSWFMVASLDEEEAFAAARSESRLMLALLGALLATVLVIAVAFWLRAQRYDEALQRTHERQQAEEELARHRDRLEVVVGERTEELRRANAALQAENAARKRAEESLACRASWAEGLQAAGEELARARTPGRILEVAARAAAELVGSHSAAIHRVDDSGETTVLAASGPVPPDVCRDREGFCLKGCASTGKPVIFPDVQGSHPCKQCVQAATEHRFNVCMTLLVPISGQGTVLFNIRASDRSGQPLIAQALPLLEVFCRQLGSAWERSLAEERSRKLSLAIEASHSSVVIVDRSGTIEYVNPRFTQVTGHAREEAVGQNLRLLDPGTHPPEFYRDQRQAIDAAKVWQGECQSRRKNGELYWESTTISPIRDAAGEITHFVAVTEDLTERRLAEREHQLILDTALDGFWIADTEGRLLEVNATYCWMSGYTQKELLRMRIPDVEATEHPEETAAHIKRIIQQGFDRFETRHRRKDGTTFEAEISVQHSFIRGGVFAVFIRDITERKRSEEALHRAKADAEAANRAKSSFLANMSHEIRTPMNAILGFAQLLDRDPTLNPTQRGHVETINRSGQHLLGLINDILEISKIESGRATLNPVAFDLETLIRNLVAMFKVRTDAKRLRFEVQIDPGLPRYVRADEGKLRQILVNLIGNAVKFTDQGGVDLEVRAVRDEASLRLEAQVRDTGPGIPEERKSSLFRPFEQLGDARKGSTGLGLAISRDFARLMGGEITVVCNACHGSTFCLNVPIEESDACGIGTPRPIRRVVALEPAQGPFRVLITDDRKENRDLLRLLLSGVGFETREASDGAAAIAVFEEWSPQVILMDLRMPGMDGYEAMRRLKATPAGRQAQVLAITAGAFDHSRQAAKEAGADGYISKPFMAEDVLTTLGDRIGARYVYEDEPGGSARDETSEAKSPPSPGVRAGSPAPGPASAVLGPDSRVALPRQLIRELRDATVAAELGRLLGLIDRVAEHDPAVAEELRHLARRYDYDALMAALGE
ncbi:MAG: PAS domain S-box protein [Candidatus Riflebacteria bacterium]|nr:PAS domain S-box protein [Candidatus Riflebacteria bacterium]